MPSCGGNFGFAVNYGGTDTYNGEAKNNVYLESGSPGGFLVDRPEAPTPEMLAGSEATP